jgi:L-rhamnose mutarotase
MRFCQVLHLKPEHRGDYIRAHANIWPEIKQLIHEANIRNYSLYLKDDLLIGVFEYIGIDMNADWKKMVESQRMKDWWALMTPMQEPLSTRAPGEWWATTEEIWHMD